MPDQDVLTTEQQASRLLMLSDTAALGEPPSASIPGYSSEAAYAVSHEMLARREATGWRTVGRKIGFTNRTIYEQYAVYEPMFGYMYDSTVSEATDANGRLVATLDLSPLVQPLIEPEIVFGLRAPLPVTDDAAALLDAVEWIAHGCEIVQCHYPDWKFKVEDTIADGGLHGRYAVGPRLTLDASMRAALPAQLASFSMLLYRNGELMAQGGGALVLDSPLNALAWLARALERLPQHPRLEEGEMVTTGTLTTALPVLPGEVWSTRMEGLELEGLEIRFV
jgi:2-oxo-3-hexenedioate decarboxylase